MIKRLLAICGTICIALCVCACSDVAVPVPEVDSQVPEQYSNTPQTSEPQKVVDEQLSSWWEVFSDGELNSLLDDVLTRNLDISIAYASLDKLIASEKESSSSLWPTLGLDGSVFRNRRNTRSFNLDSESTVSAITSTNYRVSAPVSYELDIWGRLRNSATAAQRDRLASEQDLFSVTMSIAAETVESYFLIRELCEQTILLDRTISAEEKMYDIIKKRYLDGIAKPLDVHQARQTVATRKSRLPKMKLELSKAQHTLSVLLGEYPKSRFECNKMSNLPDEIPKVPPGLPADLLMRRPDLRAAMFRLEAADQRVAAAVKRLLPSFIIGASIGYEDLELSNLFKPETFVWNLVGSITENVFDGGARSAQIDFARAEEALLRAEYLKAVLSAFKEVEDALVAEVELRDNMKLLLSRIASIRRTLRLSMSQYLQGLEDYLQVVTAQGSYYAAQSELLALRREIISNQVQLSRALGGGWDNEQVIERFKNHGDVY